MQRSAEEVGEGSHSMVTMETMRAKTGKTLVKEILTGVCGD